MQGSCTRHYMFNRAVKGSLSIWHNSLLDGQHTAEHLARFMGHVDTFNCSRSSLTWQAVPAGLRALRMRPQQNLSQFSGPPGYAVVSFPCPQVCSFFLKCHPAHRETRIPIPPRNRCAQHCFAFLMSSVGAETLGFL